MADLSRFALVPRTEFADRLEADLLRAIGDSTTSTTTPDGVLRRRLDEEHLMTVIDTPSFDEQPRRRHRGWMSALAAAAAIVLVIAGVWVMRRGDDQATAGRDVTFTVRWASTAQFNECPTDVEVPVCAWTLPRPATATFTGDIAGNAYQSGVGGVSHDEPARPGRQQANPATNRGVRQLWRGGARPLPGPKPRQRHPGGRRGSPRPLPGSRRETRGQGRDLRR